MAVTGTKKDLKNETHTMLISMRCPAELKMQGDMREKSAALIETCRAIFHDTDSKFAEHILLLANVINSLTERLEVTAAEIVLLAEVLQYLQKVLLKRYRYVHKDKKWIAHYKDEPILTANEGKEP